MSAVSGPCAPTGATTSRAPTASSGWWTALTGAGWRTAPRSCTDSSRKRYVRSHSQHPEPHRFPRFQRLAGATLLVFANKQDLPGAMTSDEIKEVKETNTSLRIRCGFIVVYQSLSTGSQFGQHRHSSLADRQLQRHDGRQPPRRDRLARGRHRSQDFHLRLAQKQNFSTFHFLVFVPLRNICWSCFATGKRNFQRSALLFSSGTVSMQVASILYKPKESSKYKGQKNVVVHTLYARFDLAETVFFFF